MLQYTHVDSERSGLQWSESSILLGSAGKTEYETENYSVCVCSQLCIKTAVMNSRSRIPALTYLKWVINWCVETGVFEQGTHQSAQDSGPVGLELMAGVRNGSQTGARESRVSNPICKEPVWVQVCIPIQQEPHLIPPV